MPPKSMLDMTEDEKSRGRHTAAVKTPPEDVKTGAKIKSTEREARLSEALRENLRRRKAGGQRPDATGEKAAPTKELKDD